MQKGIADINAETQQEFNDFQVLILNVNEQSGATKGVDAVDVDFKVDLCLLEKLSRIWKSGCVLGATPGHGLTECHWLEGKILIDTEYTLIWK